MNGNTLREFGFIVSTVVAWLCWQEIAPRPIIERFSDDQGRACYGILWNDTWRVFCLSRLRFV